MSSMQTKANKLEAKVKQLEEYFTSNQSTIAKLEEEVQQQKDNIEKLEFQNKKLQQELEAKKSTVLEKTNSQESRVQGADESTANLPPSAMTDQTVAPVEDRFKTYRTMKKLLPERAVRQKMQCDGFNEEEIQAFLDGRVVCSSASEEKGKDCSDKDSVNMKGHDTVAVPSNLKAALFTSLEGRRGNKRPQFNHVMPNCILLIFLQPGMATCCAIPPLSSCQPNHPTRMNLLPRVCKKRLFPSSHLRN